MPRFFIPKQSGRHRIACIALYRALLTRSSSLELPGDIFHLPVNPLKELVRRQFRRNQHETSQFLVITALKVGYEAEQLLQSASDGNKTALSKVVSLLREVYSQNNADHKRLQCSPPPARPRIRRPEPYPGAERVLESRPRPSSKLSGRRHIPLLANARHLPYLRFKKPQSPFLSRVLRNKLDQRQAKVDGLEKIDWDLRWGVGEDAWDALTDPSSAKEKQSWQDELRASKRNFFSEMDRQTEKATATARRMLDIVDEEKRLYEEERKAGKMLKNRKRRGRGNAGGDIE